ncbi:uncharacterized protein LOC131628221 [Vicia villosa]|uniref:uncharacterized protein LOC131628221 n=1 Tax=Vicia villosa TaxID=3911 RepID=UPI00273B1AFF|nr:uncharacterized protein LOC131628221 [Vicia villosa]
MDMHPDKSPGPDGFNPGFYQHFWECGQPIRMQDYRPISLCNVIYKVVSKALANRMKPLLEKCVSEEQSTFMEGHSILHNAMIATEIIYTLKRKTKGRRAHMSLKIDISKAYDMVDWGFLRGVMLKMGFDEIWTHWIMMCVTSVHYFVLVNSDIVGPIMPGRGLRANVAEITQLTEVLKTYAKATGQEINLNKSEVFFSRNLSLPAQEDLSKVMGVRHVLGRSLSKAGKEVMIKSVLQAILSYVMSIYILPEAVISDIEKRLNAFWWCGGSNRNGIRWMAWDKLACSKREGGLGFRDFRAFNMAMVAKQGWFIMNNSQALVSRFSKARYFPKTTFFDANLGYNPSFVWRSIWKAREVLTIGCRWSIGDGSHIKVMNEPWIRGRSEGAEEILMVPLLEDVIEDRLVWKEEQDGQYSVRSGCRVWKSRKKYYHPERHKDNWQGLWSILAPPRVKHLIWKICSGCLPSQVRLIQHHVPCPSTCRFCDVAEEDEWHVFIGCLETNSCWRTAGLFDTVAPFITSSNNIKSILLNVCSEVDRKVAGRIAVMIETLWHNRNNFIWNNEKEEASRLGWLAFHRWQDWYMAQNSPDSEAAPALWVGLSVM